MVDVEEFAGYVKDAVVRFFTDLLYNNLVAAMPWVAWPVISTVVRWVIESGVTFAATKGGLVAFMINTKIFTAAQARDYVKAVEELAKAPDTIPDDEWEKLEDQANAAFERLIRFSA